MNNLDNVNYELLVASLNASVDKLKLEANKRETESLYRFGWFYINGYKYSISGWSFKKQVVSFEREDGEKVKYSIEDKKEIMGNFKKDTKLNSISKKLRNNLADLLKDLSDKLRT